MADAISLTNGAVVLEAAPSTTITKTQPADEAMDAASFDELHLQIDVLTNPHNAVRLLTCMTRDPDDNNWNVAAEVVSAPALPIVQGARNHLVVPSTGRVLLRYVRWQFENGLNRSAVNITGMGRRR